MLRKVLLHQRHLSEEEYGAFYGVFDCVLQLSYNHLH